jgi:hypothetical protein
MNNFDRKLEVPDAVYIQEIQGYIRILPIRFGFDCPLPILSGCQFRR